MLFTRERSRSGRGGGQAVKLLLAAFSEGEARLWSRDQNYEEWYRIESLVILFDTCSITGQPFASGFKLDYRQVRYHTYIPRVPLRLCSYTSVDIYINSSVCIVCCTYTVHVNAYFGAQAHEREIGACTGSRE